MARARETFNKKEMEKSRQKKKLEKQQKKENRKTSSGKGKSFEDMLVYVDSYGNLVDEQPVKSEEIKAEDIRISTQKKEEIEAESIKTGIVNSFITERGFGFIRDSISGESIFFHSSDLLGEVKQNDKVSFETRKGPKGLNAFNVKKI